MIQKDSKLKYVTYSFLDKLKKDSIGLCCPITGKPMNDSEIVIDHKHITKKEIKDGNLGIEGKGLLRGPIINQVNVFIGKIENGWKRSGSHLLGMELPDMLRAIADYIENPPLAAEKIVHPKERPPKTRLTMMEYKRVCKYWFKMFPGKKTLPPYPKSKIKSPRWHKWVSMANELNFGKKEITRINTDFSKPITRIRKAE
jgi:hypothetical protein